MCYPYTHWNVVKLSVACHFNRLSHYRFSPLPEAINCGEPTSASSSHFLTVLFNGFLFKVLPSVGGGLIGRVGICNRSLPGSSLSTVLLQSSISLQKCSLQPVGAWVMGFHSFSGDSTDPSSCSRTMDLDMALRDNNIYLASGDSTGHPD